MTSKSDILKRIEIRTETEYKWIRIEIEYEVETVLKTNLKRFIKYVLKWNQRNIYYIY